MTRDTHTTARTGAGAGGPDDRLITARELAERWATTVGRLANDRSSRKGVQFIKLGAGSIRYSLREVVAFENASIVETSGASFGRIAA